MYHITFNKLLYKEIKKNKVKNILLGKKIKYEGKKKFKEYYKLSELKNYDLILFYLENYDDYLKNLINNLKKDNKMVLCFTDSNEIKRTLIERVNFDYLLNPHQNNKKQVFDFIHHLNSGLNHILAKLLNDKDKGIFITLNQFLRSNITNKKEKLNIIKEIGRINQNIKLARKYKVRILLDFIINNHKEIKTEREIEEILKMFSLSTEEIKNNSKELEERYKQNIFKNSDNYITEGIEVI